MVVNEGPKTKAEALRWVASETADWLDMENLFPEVKMSAAQRERVSDAVDEVARRLRLMGAPKEKGEQ